MTWLLCVGSVGCLPDGVEEYPERDAAYRAAAELVADEMAAGRRIVGSLRDGRWHDASPTSLWTCWVEEGEDGTA